MAQTGTRTNDTPIDLLGALGQAVADGDVNDFDPHNDRISFLYGTPDADSLPADDVAAAAVTALRNEGRIALQYGRTGGYPPLVDYFRTKLKRTQKMDVSADHILLTAGSTQALTQVTQLLVDRGDPIISEDPTWPGGVSLFTHVGARVIPAAMDEAGLRLDALEASLAAMRTAGERPKFIYTIPNFQNPSGVTLSLERRERLIALAREYDTFILEDDAYNDLRFEGEPLPAIYALDAASGGSRVITLGTLSKVLAAGMRLGWVVAPPALIRRLAGLKGDGGVAPFASTTAAEYCRAGKLEPHIEELNALYRARRDAMIDALGEHMPEGVTWTVPEGGFFIWLTTPDRVDTRAMFPKAIKAGIDYLPGTACRFDGHGTHEIRLSFSVMPEARIREGIARLGRLIYGEITEK